MAVALSLERAEESVADVMDWAAARVEERKRARRKTRLKRREGVRGFSWFLVLAKEMRGGDSPRVCCPSWHTVADSR